MDAVSRGDAALEAKNPAEAVDHFTQAIANKPDAVPYYIKRSTAYQRTKRYQEGLEDAEIAVTLAFKRAIRELIGQAQLRRGILLFYLQRYGDAQRCFEWAKQFNEKDKMAGVWESKVKSKLEDLEENDEKGVVTVKENPDVETATPAPAKQKKPPVSETIPTTAPEITASTPSHPVQTPASKIRHEWYQNSDTVYVTLLAKGVPKDEATVSIEPRSLSISFPLNTGSDFDFSLEPLYALVDAESSSYKILSTKIEVILKKSTPGQKWSALEGSSQISAPDSTTNSTTANGQSTGTGTSESAKVTPSPTQTAPSYPTSARTGPKNWDKIVNSYTKSSESAHNHKAKAADSGSDSKSKDGDDVYLDEFDDGGDEVNAFFRKLYAGASEDTKRAMMKSYQESGGTALSTNWDEVKKAPVPVSPPDGMEEKKW